MSEEEKLRNIIREELNRLNQKEPGKEGEKEEEEDFECPRCGNKVERYTEFCKKCGSRFIWD